MDQKRKKKRALKKSRRGNDRPADPSPVAPEAIIKATLQEFAGILARRADYLRTISTDEEDEGGAAACFDQAMALTRAARKLPDDIIEKILKAAKP